jgi:O-antigen ligase
VAAVILACLSQGPYISLWRWVANVPLSTDSWPYVLTMWVPAAIGAGWFVADVVTHLLDTSGGAFQPLVRGLAIPTTLLSWAVVSVLWTTSPAITPKQVILAGFVVASAAWFGLALSLPQQVGAVVLAMQSLTIGSLMAVIVAPSARFSAYIGDRSWIGLFGNPNLLGPVATASLLGVVGAWPLVGQKWHRLLCVLVALDLAVAVKATSVTAWLALVAGGGAIVTATVVRQYNATRVSTRRSVVVGVGVALTAILAAGALMPLVARAAGKDASFGGRRVVWRYVLSVLDGRWVNGFGFAAFWDDPVNQQNYIEYSNLDWVASSHSTFVDALLWLGVVGLALLVAVVLLGLGRLWLYAITRGGWEATWWCGVGTFALVENLAESMWLLQSPFWLLLLASGVVAVRLRANLPPLADRQADAWVTRDLRLLRRDCWRPAAQSDRRTR